MAQCDLLLLSLTLIQFAVVCFSFRSYFIPNRKINFNERVERKRRSQSYKINLVLKTLI